jgi:endogenous inhibitor of DNA gyrase (YacG/DUF329 family)
MSTGQETRLCVLCRRHPIAEEWRPFCSQRCKLQDLARWADGSYSVPGEPVSDSQEPESPDDPPKRSR